MKRLAAILILAIILIAGCTQITSSASQPIAYLEDSDVLILNSSWAFEDNCQYGNESVGYAYVSCYKKGLECEVYVNDVKSNYGPDGLQSCDDHELTIAEIELAEKPDFISVQSGNKYYYTRRDRPKVIEICCSYLNDSSHKLIRDYEICKVTRLGAQCPKQMLAPIARGFEQITMLYPWDLDSNGILNFRVKNEAGQDVVIRRVYINNVNAIPANLPMPLLNETESQNITVAGGPSGYAGNSYSIRLAIEYYLTSNSSAYNSTSMITGTYS